MLSGQISKTVPPKKKQAKTQVIYLDVFQLKTSLKPHDANFKEQNLNKKPNLRSCHHKGWKSFHAMHWIIPGFRRISGSSFIYISKIYHNSVSQFWSSKVLMQSFQFFAISRSRFVCTPKINHSWVCQVSPLIFFFKKEGK